MFLLAEKKFLTYFFVLERQISLLVLGTAIALHLMMLVLLWLAVVFVTPYPKLYILIHWTIRNSFFPNMIQVEYLTYHTAWKVSKYGVISGLYFPAFGLDTEIYEVNLCIQSEYRKIWTRNNSAFGQFSCSVRVK